MKKTLKIILAAAIGLAALWLAAFGWQEISNARLRKENHIETRPILQDWYRLRPRKEVLAATPPELPGGYFWRYADKKGSKLPQGWQAPGTKEIGNMRFDMPPFAGNYVRIAQVTLPELRRVTFKRYFLGVFPVKGMRDGCGLFSPENASASVKVFHNGKAETVNYVMTVEEDSAPTTINYIDANWYDYLSFMNPAEILAAPSVSDHALWSGLDPKQITEIPSKIYFIF